MHRYALLRTSYGLVGVTASEWGVTELYLPEPREDAVLERIQADRPDARPGASRTLDRASEQILAYFQGRPVEFTVPLDLKHLAGFRARVYEAAMRIPWGKTASYAEIAREAGSPRGARAVGGALGANPIPLIIPCHRVIASGGKLGGFSAPGGDALKAAMLRLEGIVLV